MGRDDVIKSAGLGGIFDLYVERGDRGGLLLTELMDGY